MLCGYLNVIKKNKKMLNYNSANFKHLKQVTLSALVVELDLFALVC